jgi:hypothetical protein
MALSTLTSCWTLPSPTLARFAKENPKELIVLNLSLEGSVNSDRQRVINNLGHCTFPYSVAPSMGLDAIIATGGNIMFWSGYDNDFITNQSVYAHIIGDPNWIEKYYKDHCASVKGLGKAWVWYTGVPAAAVVRDPVGLHRAFLTPLSDFAKALDDFFPPVWPAALMMRSCRI